MATMSNAMPITDEDVRQQICQSALRLFRENGYAAVTMPAIAEAAGISLANCQHHFPNKLALAAASYSDKVEALAAFTAGLPKGQLADRYHQLLQETVEIMGRDRAAMQALFAAALAEETELDLMAGFLAERLAGSCYQLVLSSEDALPETKARHLGIVLYTFQMLVLLFWFYDRSPQQAATDQLVETLHGLFKLLRPLFFLPLIPDGIAKLAKIVMPQLASIEASASEGPAAQEDPRDGQQEDFDIHRE